MTTDEDSEDALSEAAPSARRGTLPSIASPARSMTSWENNELSRTHSSPHSELVGDRLPMPSFANEGPNGAQDKFATVFNHPHTHIVKLVTASTTASAASPNGEVFTFSVSTNGGIVVAYNSSRLFLVTTTSLPEAVTRAFKVSRRPLTAHISDDGAVLAILSDEHRINVYLMIDIPPRRVRTVTLDQPARCLTLSATGALLAVAYSGGLEVYSLAYGATDIDRRGVQTQTLERLAFSADSHLLLGTTTDAIQHKRSATVVVSVPIFPEAVNGIPTAEELRQAWTGDILRAQEDYYTSHASYIKDHSTGGPDRVFAWNEKEGSFGIMDVEVMRWAEHTFPMQTNDPSTRRARTAGIGTVPAVSGSGDVAAVVVHRTLIQLYSLLQHQEEDPTGNVRTRGASYSVEEAVARPVTEVAWTQEWATQQHSCRRRLIVCSAGGKQVPSESTEYASETPEAGRIIVLDFDEALPGGKNLEVTIDLDDDNVPLLEEQELDLQTEISIVRRRTQRQQKSDAIKRSLTSPRPSNRDGSYGAGPYLNRAAPQSTGNLPEMAESFEQPYSQGQPRSQLSLQRAATSIVRRHPVALPPPRAANRDDLTAEPLPLYSAEPNAPLPGHLRPLAGLRPLPIRQTYGPGTNQEPYLAPNYATPEPPEPSPNRHSSIRRPLPPAASPGLRRGPSRASRSAAANVAPLRKKGWLGRRKERKARKQAADERGTGGSKEDRKCAVM